MTEFDRNGFLAVDKFFEEQHLLEEKEEKDRKHDDNLAKQKLETGSTSNGQRRGGVGVVTANKNGSFQLENVLLVGKKRRHSKRSLQEIDDDHSLPLQVENLEDDDLDVGRTAIAKEYNVTKKSKTATIQIDTSVQKSSKKSKRKNKLGKSERLRMPQRKEVEPTEQASSLSQDNAKSSKQAEATNNKATTNQNDPNPSSTNNNKRKRHKVRSRQKNIRKDTRAMSNKPAHLIAGNPNYQGRPLTQATRDRLKQSVTTGKRILATDTDSTRRMTITAKSIDQPNPTTSNELFVIDRNSADDVGVEL
jgi:hypothetical protein